MTLPRNNRITQLELHIIALNFVRGNSRRTSARIMGRSAGSIGATERSMDLYRGGALRGHKQTKEHVAKRVAAWYAFYHESQGLV